MTKSFKIGDRVLIKTIDKIGIIEDSYSHYCKLRFEKPFTVIYQETGEVEKTHTLELNKDLILIEETEDEEL